MKLWAVISANVSIVKDYGDHTFDLDVCPSMKEGNRIAILEFWHQEASNHVGGLHFFSPTVNNSSLEISEGVGWYKQGLVIYKNLSINFSLPGFDNCIAIVIFLHDGSMKAP